MPLVEPIFVDEQYEPGVHGVGAVIPEFGTYCPAVAAVHTDAPALLHFPIAHIFCVLDAEPDPQ
jgi:hypothetical protein